MPRLLALLLAAFPLAAAAQTSGQALFDGVDAPVINRVDCLGETLQITWQLKEESLAKFVPGSGLIDIYAAAADKSETGFPPCHYAEDGSGVTMGAILDSPIDNPTSALGTASGPIATLAARAGFDCTTADKTVYVCVVYRPSTGATPVAYAKGTVVLKVQAPDAPTVTKVVPGEKALNVTIAEATTGSVESKYFKARAIAMAPADAIEHFSPAIYGPGKTRIEGLVNGTEYEVTAFAYSPEDNRSTASAPFSGGWQTPVNVQDAWEHYDPVGRDDGGCQAGGAGLAALLGAAALLRLRRRA